MTKHFPAICEEHGTIVQNKNGIGIHRNARNCYAAFLPMFSKDKKIQKKIKQIEASRFALKKIEENQK